MIKETKGKNCLTPKTPSKCPTGPPLLVPGHHRVVPLGEALVRRSLPLSHEMVGTDMSPADNEGACFHEGVAGGQQRTRAVERFKDLVFGENPCCWKISCLGGFGAVMCRGWFTDLP